MSERITWTTCPHCGGPAAIGWLQERPIEFDCTAGCTVTDRELLCQATAPYGPLSGPIIPPAS